jgi:hypothetical protein
MSDLLRHHTDPVFRNVGDYQQVTQCSELSHGTLNPEQCREHSEMQPMFRVTQQLGILCNLLYSSMLPRYRDIYPTRA